MTVQTQQRTISFFWHVELFGKWLCWTIDCGYQWLQLPKNWVTKEHLQFNTRVKNDLSAVYFSFWEHVFLHEWQVSKNSFLIRQWIFEMKRGREAWERKATWQDGPCELLTMKVGKDCATNYRGSWENYLQKLGLLAEKVVGQAKWARKMCLQRTVAWSVVGYQTA